MSLVYRFSLHYFITLISTLLALLMMKSVPLFYFILTIIPWETRYARLQHQRCGIFQPMAQRSLRSDAIGSRQTNSPSTEAAA